MIDDFIKNINLLLQGRVPARIDTEQFDDEHERELGEKLNQLADFIRETHAFIIPLSKGELNDIKVQPNNYLASPFKELHSRLVHLTWQASQVAKGDYAQRVDFMGEFSEAFNAMIVALDENEKLLKKKIDELEEALSHIAKLEGILPICANCKRIRLENTPEHKQDSWVPIENYIRKRTKAEFSHGICPECMKKLYPWAIDEEDQMD